MHYGSGSVKAKSYGSGFTTLLPGSPSHALELLDENFRPDHFLQVGLAQDLRLPASNMQTKEGKSGTESPPS
jgi:hypothetical protein